MKILKFFTCAMILVALASCQKHEITYNTRDLDNTDAEFQLHYFEPVLRNAAEYYIDSVFVNGILYSSVNGSGQLQSYNAVPGGSAGRFFAVKAGDVKFTFWRGGEVVYENNATLVGGKKQNVFVYDMTKAPIVIENDFPYELDRPAATAKDWGTDSVASVRFYNFMYEEPGVPYPGKLQYQWRNDVKDADGNWVWHNVGEPVGFGQASTRAMLIVHKTVYNSEGYQSIWYRILKEDGNILQTVREGKTILTDYSDYWTAYIGRAYTHIWAGVRTSGKPHAWVSQWANK